MLDVWLILSRMASSEIHHPDEICFRTISILTRKPSVGPQAHWAEGGRAAL